MIWPGRLRALAFLGLGLARLLGLRGPKAEHRGVLLVLALGVLLLSGLAFVFVKQGGKSYQQFLSLHSGQSLPEILRDYTTYGLVPNPEGEGYVLACPPRIEAAVYAGAGGEDGAAVYEAVESLDIPVRVMRARPRTPENATDMSSSPTAPDLASFFKHGEDLVFPEHSHFLPMEAPDLVARHILEL